MKVTVALVAPVLGTGWPSGQVLDLALGLARVPVPVVVLAEEGRLAHELERRGIPVEVGPLPRRPFLDRRRVRQLRDLLRRHRKDGDALVLHGHGADSAVPAALIASSLHAELVLTLYDRADARAVPPLEGERLGAIFVTSEASEEELVNRRGVPRELVHHAGLGLDPGRCGLSLDETLPAPELTASDEELTPVLSTGGDAPAAEPRGPRLADPAPPAASPPPAADSLAHPPFPPGRLPVIGALGRLEPLGGHEALLRAAQELAAQALDFQVLVVGEGPGKHELLLLARELGLSERVVFAGDLPGRGEFFETIDVFVAPALREGFGHDLLEAMARGRPVIATGSGAIFEHVRDGETGILLPQNDASALARALARLLAAPGEARAMGRRARAAVGTRFPVERLVDQTLRVYERAFAAR